MTKYILGVDPGDTSGVVVMTHEAHLEEMHNIPAAYILDTLTSFSKDYDFDTVIVEDYRIYGHKAEAHKGSKVPAIKVIGSLEMWAKMNGAKVIYQPASILPIARKWSKGIPKGSHKDLHFVDAYNHVYYWLVQKGKVKPKGQR